MSAQGARERESELACAWCAKQVDYVVAPPEGKGPCICDGCDKAYERGLREGLERAAKQCQYEKVDAESTGEESDVAYNLACDHCSASIRQIK